MGDRIKSAFDKYTSFRTLELVNSWIIAADNKSSIFLAFIAIIVGFSVNTFSNINKFFINGSPSQITMIVIIGLLYIVVLGITILQLIFVFIARTSIKDNFKENFVSFVSISEMQDTYIDKAKTVDDDKISEMILSQIKTNSKIAFIKMKHFNFALKFGILLIPLTIVLTILMGLI